MGLGLGLSLTSLGLMGLGLSLSLSLGSLVWFEIAKAFQTIKLPKGFCNPANPQTGLQTQVSLHS